MTRTVDTLTDDEVAAYIEARRHRPRPATGYDIHSQRMKWAVEERCRALEAENAQYREALKACAASWETFDWRERGTTQTTAYRLTYAALDNATLREGDTP